MTDDEVLGYVKAAAAALDLPLDDVAARRVAGHLAGTALLARQLDGAVLQVDDEPAEVFRPAPFAAGEAE